MAEASHQDARLGATGRRIDEGGRPGRRDGRAGLLVTAQDGAARRAVSEESPDDVLPELYRQLRWRMGLVLYRYRR
jgi:hypothetical protein